MHLIIAVFMSMLLIGCSTLSGTASSSDERASVPYAGYIAINPIALSNTAITERSPAEITAFNKSNAPSPNLEPLVNNAARVTLRQVSSSGKISYLVSAVTTENFTYYSTIDYIKYCSVPIPLTINKGSVTHHVTIGAAVGVGLRAEATFCSRKDGVSIADLVNIGISAQNNKLSGTMSFQTMGIENKAISDALPIPSELSLSTVQQSLQTMATVKANIYDHDTRVIPQIVGIEIQSYPEGVTLADILDALRRSQSEGVTKNNMNQLEGLIPVQSLSDKVENVLKKQGVQFFR